MSDPCDTFLRRLRAAQQALDWEAVDACLESRPEAESSDDPSVLAALAAMHAVRGSRDQAKEKLDQVSDDAVAHHSSALSDLGLTRIVLGDASGAEAALRQAIDNAAPDPAAFARLAAIEMADGRLDDAENHFNRCLDRMPDKPEVLSNLAGIRVRQNRLDEALDLYSRALTQDPTLDVAKSARLQIFHRLGRIDDLIEEERAKAEAAPDDPFAQLNYAGALNQAERDTEAAQVLETAIDNFPKTFALRVALVRLLMRQRKWWRLGQKLLAWLPEYEAGTEEHARLRLSLNRARIEARFLDAAETDLDATPPDERREPDWTICRARLANERGSTEDAVELLEGVVQQFPGTPEGHSLLAHYLTLLGRADEAQRHQDKLAQLSPDGLANYLEAREDVPSERELDTLERLRDSPTQPRETRSSIGFSLARIYDRMQEYDRAFEVLDAANRGLQDLIGYDYKTHRRLVQGLMRQFDYALIERFLGQGLMSRRPIFVVGMPRSGTTLTEQILASHPQVFGAGELSTVSRITRLMPKVVGRRVPYPAAMRLMSVRNLQSAANYYLKEIAKFDDQAERVVDKLPHNFDHIGLIALMFPNATIIHLKRDPRDVAVSNYFQNFAAARGMMGFAFDLADIGHMLNDHDRIMQHWHEVLPGRVYELSYEQLVHDPETEVAKLLAHCGLPWDDAVLRFYETQRPVKTASVRQVRQGFYTSSAEKWRRYEAHLGPLEEVLAQGFEPVEPAPQAAGAEEGQAARFQTAAATKHG